MSPSGKMLLKEEVTGRLPIEKKERLRNKILEMVKQGNDVESWFSNAPHKLPVIKTVAYRLQGKRGCRSDTWKLRQAFK
jgi:hypothetical protein